MWFALTQPPYGTSMPQSGRRPQHHLQTFGEPKRISALPPKEGIRAAHRYVCLGEERTFDVQVVRNQFLGRLSRTPGADQLLRAWPTRARDLSAVMFPHSVRRKDIA